MQYYFHMRLPLILPFIVYQSQSAILVVVKFVMAHWYFDKWYFEQQYDRHNCNGK